VVIEGVWAMAKNGKGPLFVKYTELNERMNKKKSATLEKKLNYYKVKNLEELGSPTVGSPT
jgi:hypothetical protein